MDFAGCLPTLAKVTVYFHRCLRKTSEVVVDFPRTLPTRAKALLTFHRCLRTLSEVTVDFHRWLRQAPALPLAVDLSRFKQNSPPVGNYCRFWQTPAGSGQNKGQRPAAATPGEARVWPHFFRPRCAERRVTPPRSFPPNQRQCRDAPNCDVFVTFYLSNTLRLVVVSLIPFKCLPQSSGK